MGEGNRREEEDENKRQKSSTSYSESDRSYERLKFSVLVDLVRRCFLNVQDLAP